MNPNRAVTNVRQWRAELHGLEIPNGLQIERVTVHGGDASLTTSPFSLGLESPARLEASVHESALLSYLSSLTASGLRDASISISSEGIRVEATVKVFVDLRVRAICALRIEDGARLFVDLVSVDILGAAPKGLVQKQLDLINPVLDVSDLAFEFELDQVELVSERIVIRGRGRPKPSGTSKS